MKVAMVSNFFPPEAQGGAEIYASDLATALASRGLTIEVFTSTRLRERTERRGNLTVRFFRCAPPFPRLTSDILGYNFNPWARRLARAVAEGGYDLVHIHNINSTIMLSPLVKALRQPAVCHVHDHWPICYRGVMLDTWHQVPCISARPSCCFNPGRRVVGAANLALRERLLRCFESSIARFIVPSRHMMQALVARGFTRQEKIQLVRLGLDVSKLPPESTSRGADFLFVGRLTRYKNPQLAIELLSRGRVDPRVCFRILGGGPPTVLKSLANVGEAQRHRVHVLGHKSRDAIFSELVRARGLLIPSLIPENSPLVAYEALACGTPIICSDLGGTKELVQESRAGEILSTQDISSWERAINSLLNGDFLEMSRRAASFAHHNLGIDKSADGVLEVYDEISGR